jgi:hypothetical protein
MVKLTANNTGFQVLLIRMHGLPESNKNQDIFPQFCTTLCRTPWWTAEVVQTVAIDSFPKDILA